MININKNNDEFNRYKMHKLKVVYLNKKKLFTNIENLHIISNDLEIDNVLLLKYFSFNLGCSINNNYLSGIHNIDKLNDILFKFIDNFIICLNCGLPEINYNYNDYIYLSCKSCGCINKFNYELDNKIIKLFENYCKNHI